MLSICFTPITWPLTFSHHFVMSDEYLTPALLILQAFPLLLVRSLPPGTPSPPSLSSGRRPNTPKTSWDITSTPAWWDRRSGSPATTNPSDTPGRLRGGRGGTHGWGGGCDFGGLFSRLFAPSLGWQFKITVSVRFVVHGLVPGETYVFRVQAVNVYGLSEESQESSPIAVEPALGENNTENHNTVSCLDRLEKLKKKKRVRI